jgi:hypothetical protein
MKRKTIFSAFIALVCLFILQSSVIAQPGKVSFSGTWTYDESKGDKLNTGWSTMIVNQIATSMVQTVTYKASDGKLKTFTNTYYFDGKDHLSGSTHLLAR